MVYELWETASRNMVGDFETEADAMAAVLEAADLTPPEDLECLSLLYIGDADSHPVARGSRLIAMARDFFQPARRLARA